jgi:hypothetical protein
MEEGEMSWDPLDVILTNTVIILVIITLHQVLMVARWILVEGADKKSTSSSFSFFFLLNFFLLEGFLHMRAKAGQYVFFFRLSKSSIIP